MSRRSPATLAVAVLATFALVAVGCGTTSGTSSGRSSSAQTPLKVGNNHGTLTDSFNPFSPGSSTAFGALAGETNLIYETLLYNNIYSPRTMHPWLATSYKFSDGGRTLVLDIRHNVKWSDGAPFTAADVVFTFNLLLHNAAANPNKILPSAITQTGAYAVTLKFSTPEYVNLYWIGTTPIIPKHVWEHVTSPLDYQDSHPVGTGPYTVSRFSSSNVIFTKNPQYWQPGLPKITTIYDTSYDSDANMDLAAEDNQLDQIVAPIEHYQTLFVKPDPSQHIVQYPVVNQLEALMVNLKRYPYNLLPVREAISDAIDRQLLSVDGESSQFPPATTPTGLVMPIDKAYMAPAYASLKLNPTSNVAAAKKLLLGAGFSYHGSKLIMPNGKAFTATISDPASYSDYVLDDSILADELRTLGIQVTVTNSSPGAWTSAVNDGDFDITVCYSYGSGPTPYYYFNAELNSGSTAPIGKPASGDVERFSSPTANALLANFVATGSQSKQTKDIQGLERIMVEQMPFIMLFNQTLGYPYSTKNFTNWPTEADPYASPFSEQEMIHVTPRG